MFLITVMNLTHFAVTNSWLEQVVYFIVFTANNGSKA